jgi:hypothetical protein
MILEALTRGGFLPWIVGLRTARRRARVRNQPSHRTLRYMMPDFTIALAIGLVIGFILGYGLRAIISYRRRQRARRRSVPLLSLVCRMARPAAARTDQMTAATCPRSPCSSSALTVSPPREKGPPQPIAAHGRVDPAYHPDPSVERWRRQFWVLGGLHYQYFKA